jgi:uncharacterized RDD family membrane protein YckC
VSGASPIPPYLPPPAPGLQPGRAAPQDRPAQQPTAPFQVSSQHLPPQADNYRAFGAQPPNATAGLRYADWGERVGASLMDYALLVAAILVLSPLSASDSLSGLAGLVWCALAGYLGWLNGSKGQSPGKALMGLKVVRDADGSTLGGPVGLVRGAILLVMGGLTGGVLFVLAVLWPAWDARKQALHDKIVSATVVAGYPRARLSKQIFLP